MRALSDDRRVLRAIARLLFPGLALLCIERPSLSMRPSLHMLMMRSLHNPFASTPYPLALRLMMCTLPTVSASPSRQFLAAARGQDTECLPIFGYCAPGNIDLVVVQNSRDGLIGQRIVLALARD